MSIINAADFGDGSAGITAALSAVWRVSVGTMAISDTVTLTDCRSLSGDGPRSTTVTYAGSGAAFATPDAGAGGGYAHTLYQRLGQMCVAAATHHVGTGFKLTLTGYASSDRFEAFDLAVGIEMRGAVGSTMKGASLWGCEVGLLAGGFASLDASTHNCFNYSRFEGCRTAIKVQGPLGSNYLKGLHFTGTVIESCSSVFDADGKLVSNLTFRDGWFEDNGPVGSKGVLDLSGCITPVIDTSHFSARAEVLGGWGVVLRNIDVTGVNAIGVIRTTADAAFVTAATSNWTDAGAHGLELTMPWIGSASSPVDLYSPSECAQSFMIGELAGTLFGYGQPTANIIPRVSQVAYDPNGFWPYGDAVVANGQPDMFGGTNAVKLTGTLHGCAARPTVAGWCSLQVAASMVVAGERFGMYVESQTASLLNKTLSFEIPDTGIRMFHMRFKAPDNAGTQIYLRLPVSGVIIHRIGLFQGAEIRPMIAEGASIPLPFLMQFGNVEVRGIAPPSGAGGGTWRRGDRMVHSAPAVGSPKAWRCTASGTPGTWVSEGNL